MKKLMLAAMLAGGVFAVQAEETESAAEVVATTVEAPVEAPVQAPVEAPKKNVEVAAGAEDANAAQPEEA